MVQLSDLDGRLIGRELADELLAARCRLLAVERVAALRQQIVLSIL